MVIFANTLEIISEIVYVYLIRIIYMYNGHINLFSHITGLSSSAGG